MPATVYATTTLRVMLIFILMLWTGLNAQVAGHSGAPASRQGTSDGATLTPTMYFTQSDVGVQSNAIQQRFFTGTHAGDEFGAAVSSAGDVNGDGFSDFIAGAIRNDAGGQDAGRAYIFFGGRILDSAPDVILTGVAPGDNFGRAVSSAGDVNRDGYADVIVGADLSDTAGNSSGSAYLFFGGPVMDSEPDLILSGLDAGDRFGFDVSGGGDLNGDGFDDLFVGAPLAELIVDDTTTVANVGAAYVFYGGINPDATADVVLAGESANDFFGTSVAIAGDSNGDRIADALVGAFGNATAGVNAGRAYLFFGGAVMDPQFDVAFTGEAANDNFGTAVADAGDVNADGFSDMLVGASGNDVGGNDAGRAYLFLGGSDITGVPDVIYTGSATGDRFGISVSSAGDIDGDNFGDVIIGAERNDAGGSDTGRAFIHVGGPFPDTAVDAILTGSQDFENFGIAVATAGDVNGDGYDDVLVGANLNNAAGARAGRAYLFLNTSRGTDIADEAFTQSASALAILRDFDGDRAGDILLGFPNSAQNGLDAGSADLFLGGSALDATPEITFQGFAAGLLFGTAVADAGDVNGDLLSDVVVGAPTDGAFVGSGNAFIFFGGALDTEPDVVLGGSANHIRYGSDVSTAGDVNADGFSDILVLTTLADSAAGLPAEVLVYFGGAAMDTLIDLHILLDVPEERVALAAGGDVNGDGFSDILIGISGDANTAGSARIYFGGAPMDNRLDVTLSGPAAGSGFNATRGWVAGFGDVNDDGFHDVVVGDGAEGFARVYFGGIFMDSEADAVLRSPTGDATGGTSVAVGDVNADRFADLIVGAGNFGADSSGLALVYFGGAAISGEPDIVLNAPNAGKQFGLALATGDVNRDGRSDVLVGGGSAGARLFLSSAPTIVPVITGVHDLPNDQGGRVQVTWNRSGYDIVGDARIANYIVQRQTAAVSAVWEVVADVGALQQATYAAVVPTLFDSSATSDGLAVFRVIARTDRPAETWTSGRQSGFSVDNLAPDAPATLTAKADEDGSVALAWNANRVDPDVAIFAVHRGPSADFVPNADTEIGATDDTVFVDTPPTLAAAFYRVVTLDVNGNTSQPSPGVAPCLNDGDVDGDGTLSTVDVLCAFNIFLNGQQPTGGCNAADFACEVIAADVNCDGRVTPVDALAISAASSAGMPPSPCFARDGIPLLKSQSKTIILSSRVVPATAMTSAGFEVAITLSEPRDLSAFGLTLTFPPSLSLEGITFGNGLQSWRQIQASEIEAGSVRIGGFADRTASQERVGEIVRLRFSGDKSGASSEAFVITELQDDLKNAAVELKDAGASVVPERFALHPNFPNPFNPETSIGFDISRQSGESVHVRLAIYNLEGQRVRTLANEQRAPGSYGETWDGRNDAGVALPSGTYVYRLQAGSFTASRKMLLLK